MNRQIVWSLLLGLGVIVHTAVLWADVPQELTPLSSCTTSTAGTICGAAFAPDGVTPLSSSAVVEVLSDGTPPTTLETTGCYTNALGYFYCGCASEGTHTFKVDSILVDITFTATCQAGGVPADPDTTDAVPHAAYIAKTENVAPMAIVRGSYDHVEDILASVFQCGSRAEGYCDKMTFYDSYNYVAFLNDLNAMKQYKAIFLNCGMSDGYEFASVIDRYIDEAGGLVYASDWTYPYIEHAYPDKIEWYSSDTSANGLVSTAEEPALIVDGGNYSIEPYVGVSNLSQPATIEDPYLQDFLEYKGLIASGISAADVVFDLDSWVVMTEINTTEQAGIHTVISAASLEAGVAGNPEAAYSTGQKLPIAVSYCNTTSGGGFIYTSYHIEGDATKTSVQEDSLAFLVTNSQSRCLQQESMVVQSTQSQSQPYQPSEEGHGPASSAGSDPVPPASSSTDGSVSGEDDASDEVEAEEEAEVEATPSEPVGGGAILVTLPPAEDAAVGEEEGVDDSGDPVAPAIGNHMQFRGGIFVGGCSLKG